MPVTLYNLSAWSITDKTIEQMHAMVKQAKLDHKFIQLITEIVSLCPPKDSLCEVKTIYNTFKKLITYRKDPHQIEMVKSVWKILEEPKVGDCDCVSVLISAAAGALGFPYQFVTIKSDLTRPEDWSHVYPRIYVNGQWMGADLTVARAYLGWEPPDVYERKIWDEPVY